MARTLEDVAKRAGVSRSTVSRVINDHPSVSDETRKRVLQAIEECGYRPHAVARSLATRKTNILAIVVPESVTKLFTDPYFPLMLRGATEACNRRGYQLILSLFTVSMDSKRLRDSVLRSGYIEGVISANASLDDELIPSLLKEGLPFITIGRHPDPRVGYVDVDNAGGARMATEYLLRLGHRRIAVITGPGDMTPAQDRLAGFQAALAPYRVDLPDEWIVEGDFTETGGRRAMEQLLVHKPTAVFVSSDSMAIGAVRAIKEEGLRVPGDISVIGFDDIPSAETAEPALTTVRQPIESLGEMTAGLLIDCLDGPDDPASVPRIILPTELVVRGSAAPPVEQ